MRFSPRILAMLGLTAALLALPQDGHALRAAPVQQGGMCQPNTNVVPGTCICPGGTQFRMNMTRPNMCGTNGQCVCPPNANWNGSQCITCPPGANWNGSQCISCGGGQRWNGSACVCAPGSNWNGSQCVTCAGGQQWSGNQCACPAGSNWSGQRCMTCPAGTNWAGNRCIACTGGATWNGSVCVPPPPPPPPPPPAANCGGRCGANQACVNNMCVGTGQLSFSLWWDKNGDLDLQVMTPNRLVISPTGRSADGGTLDVDDTDGTGPENIFWSSQPPPGTYHVCVSAFNVPRNTNFTLQVRLPNGQTQVYNGTRNGTQRSTCAPGSPSFVASINVGGRAELPPQQGGTVVVQQPPQRGSNSGAIVTPGSTQQQQAPQRTGQVTVTASPTTQQTQTGGRVVVEGRPVTTVQGGVVVEGSGQMQGGQSTLAFEVVPNGTTRASRTQTLQFVGWDGQRYEVRIEGSTFVVAPNGDWSRATRTETLQFVGWDGQRWGARVAGMGFSIALNGDFSRARTENGVQFTAWDQSRITVRLSR